MEEQEILAGLRQPHRRAKAFDQLVRAYQRPLYFHVRRLVVDHEDTDDVLQNTFLKAWRGLEGFRGEAKLKTWLYRIATNEALTWLKQRQRRAYTDVATLEDDLHHSLWHSPYVDGDEVQLRLQAAILTLPPRQRAVFHLRYYDEMPYEEMAAVLQVTVGALKASYHHAVKKIEKHLTEAPA